MAFTIKVNGRPHSVDVDGDTPLLWVLRDVLGMTGTKFGCGMALCGACTVHVDGVATRSCITPIDSIGDVRDHDDRGDRRDARPAPRSRRPGSTARSSNAATASRARSCRLRRCSRAIRIRPMPTSTTRCPATSAAAGPMSAFAKRSSRPRSRADREADHDHRSPQFPSRRPGRAVIGERSLPAQLPAGRSGRGRRPDAEPQPAVRNRRSRSGRRRRVRAQRLHPHRRRRADRPDHALCRDGPGHLHLDPDADRRRAGGGPQAGAAGACAAQRKALRQSLAGRAGDGQLERDPRGVAAAAPSRRDRENHAGCGGGEALECRSGVLPRAKRRSASRADGTTHRATASLPPTPPACRSPKTWRSSDRRISSSSARRPSGSTRRRRSTARPSTASTFGRRA